MEHVPPRAFFPAHNKKDGENKFRRNLIKVPSCNKHNAEKSGDDVYALFHIAAQDGLNHCGQMMQKELKRLAQKDRDERGGRFMKLLVSEILGFDPAGRPVVKPNRDRMMEYLRLVARGVYYAQKFEKLLGPLEVANVGNLWEEERAEDLHKREKHFVSEIGDSKVHGDNPDVFNYSICNRPGGIILIQLVFYGTAKCWVFYAPPQITHPLIWVPKPQICGQAYCPAFWRC